MPLDRLPVDVPEVADTLGREVAEEVGPLRGEVPRVELPPAVGLEVVLEMLLDRDGGERRRLDFGRRDRSGADLPLAVLESSGTASRLPPISDPGGNRPPPAPSDARRAGARSGLV